VTAAKAGKVAEAAGAAWHGHHGPGSDSYAVGVIAALALLGQGPDGRDPRQQVLKASDADIAVMLTEVWCLFTIARPELAIRVGPFAEWLNDDPLNPHLVTACSAVARVAVRAGLLDMTLVRDTSVDVLGPAWTLLRTGQARQAQGEFYTPEPVALAMAQLTLGDDPPAGSRICDPAAGTGGVLRGAAEALRHAGRNPHDYWWVGNDTSPVAVACLAVNAHLWDLGPRVLFGVANSLTEPGWEERAAREQDDAVDRQRERADLAAGLAAWQQAFAAIEALTAPEPEPAPCPERDAEGHPPLFPPITGNPLTLF
jgi:N-6 DNA Methylase